MGISKYINILACPSCHNKLISTKSKLACSNLNCKEEFDIIEDVPILIPKKIEPENLKQLIHQSDWFDRHYSGFKEYKLENWRKSMIKRVFEGLDINENNKKWFYLDIGVGGSGYTVIEAARKGLVAIGTDLSLTGVLSAKRFAKEEGVEDKSFFIVCSAEYLPFKNETIQRISCLSVLEHLHNDRKAIAEISRISIYGGKTFITVPNTYKKMWFFLWPFYYFMDKKIGHLRHYSEKNLMGLFSMSGQRCVEVFYNGHLIKFYQLLLEKIGLINDKGWWSLENKDLSFKNNKMGVQLNILFEKVRS